MVLFDKFLETVNKYPDLIVFADKNKNIKYKELYQEILEMSEYLKEKGVKYGDYVTVMITMSVDLYKVLISLWFLGAIPVFFDVSAKNNYIEKCSQIIKPKFIIGTTLSLLYIKKIISLKNIQKINIKHNKMNVCHYKHVDNNENTPAIITFTSGSTGIPKTIVRTHQFLLNQYNIISSTLNYQSLTVDLGFLPIFTLANIATGITTVIPNTSLKNMGKINAKNIVKQIEKFKVNSMTVSPVVLSQILEYAHKYKIKLKSLKTIHIGGGPVFPSMLPYINEFDANVYIVYGSSEAEPISIISWEKMLSLRNKITLGYGLPVGKIINDISLKIINDDIPLLNTTLDTKSSFKVGEIIVTGDNVLKGYYKGVGDKENKINVKGVIWHRTGDCGYIDDNNILWLLGRKNSLIKYNNTIIFPFSFQSILKEKYNIHNSAFLKIQNNIYLVLEKRDKKKLNNILKNFKYKDVNIIFVKRIPMDKRHSAKIDINELKKMILKL